MSEQDSGPFGGASDELVHRPSRVSDLEIQVSEDHLTARINRIDDTTTQEVVHASLQGAGIKYGIDHQAIGRGVALAMQGQIQRGVAVAHGLPVRLLEPARFEFLDGLEASGRALGRLSQLLQSPSANVFSGWEPPMVLVAAGDVLAELVPARYETGRDVYGRDIQADFRHNATFRAGSKVAVDDDGGRYIAEVYGYAGVFGGELMVLPPIWVAPDLMEACFVCLPTVGDNPPMPTLNDLKSLLEFSGVSHGANEDSIYQIYQSLEHGLGMALLAAQGTPATAGEDARIEYLHELEDLLAWVQLRSVLSAASVQDLADVVQELAEASGPIAICRAVTPGDVLAELVPATDGYSGIDLAGEPVQASEGEDALLQVGENATLVDDGLRVMADKYGFVCLRVDQVVVVPPLWIAPDNSAAYFLNLPQGDDPVYPSLAQIQELLADADVTHGFDTAYVREVLDVLERGDQQDLLIPLARATPAQAGKEAEFTWDIPVDRSTAGTILEDGSIDFRERRLITAVNEGDLLGWLKPSDNGVPGMDVTGEQILPAIPAAIEVVADQHIVAETTTEGTEYRAAAAGGVDHKFEHRRGRYRIHRRLRLSISPISNITGDVDYSTGNIDFTGSVMISGSIQPLFSVKATGSVSVAGYVEAGAAVQAGGDVVVGGGIVGVDTTVAAGGDLLAKFVQEASLRASGDLHVGAYIFNASVRAHGRVVVAGRGEGKTRALVGGLVWAGDGIAALSIGSPYSRETRVVAGIDPDQSNRLDQLRANLESCVSRQLLMTNQLGMEELDVGLLKQRLQQTSSPQGKKAIILSIKRIARLAELRRDLEREIEDLLAAQRELSHSAKVEVQGTLFSGVELRIGEAKLRTSQDSKRVCAELSRDGEEEVVSLRPLV